MEYEIGRRLDTIDEKLNWIVAAMHDNDVKPNEGEPDGSKEDRKDTGKK